MRISPINFAQTVQSEASSPSSQSTSQKISQPISQSVPQSQTITKEKPERHLGPAIASFLIPGLG